MDEMERRTQQARRFIAGEGVFAGMRSAWHCVRRAACGTWGLADYRWALPRTSSVAIATQAVHRLQIHPIVHI